MKALGITAAGVRQELLLTADETYDSFVELVVYEHTIFVHKNFPLLEKISIVRINEKNTHNYYPFQNCIFTNAINFVIYNEGSVLIDSLVVIQSIIFDTKGTLSFRNGLTFNANFFSRSFIIKEYKWGDSLSTLVDDYAKIYHINKSNIKPSFDNDIFERPIITNLTFQKENDDTTYYLGTVKAILTKDQKDDRFSDAVFFQRGSKTLTYTGDIKPNWSQYADKLIIDELEKFESIAIEGSIGDKAFCKVKFENIILSVTGNVCYESFHNSSFKCLCITETVESNAFVNCTIDAKEATFGTLKRSALENLQGYIKHLRVHVIECTCIDLAISKLECTGIISNDVTIAASSIIVPYLRYIKNIQDCYALTITERLDCDVCNVNLEHLIYIDMRRAYSRFDNIRIIIDSVGHTLKQDTDIFFRPTMNERVPRQNLINYSEWMRLYNEFFSVRLYPIEDDDDESDDDYDDKEDRDTNQYIDLLETDAYIEGSYEVSVLVKPDPFYFDTENESNYVVGTVFIIPTFTEKIHIQLQKYGIDRYKLLCAMIFCYSLLISLTIRKLIF